MYNFNLYLYALLFVQNLISTGRVFQNAIDWKIKDEWHFVFTNLGGIKLWLDYSENIPQLRRCLIEWNVFECICMHTWRTHIYNNVYAHLYNDLYAYIYNNVYAHLHNNLYAYIYNTVYAYIYNYEWAKRTKFLLAVIYGSVRRH